MGRPPTKGGNDQKMKRNRRASPLRLLVALLATGPASTQKAGGILKMYTVDSPASMSILDGGG
jgi:hypothetical protein